MVGLTGRGLACLLDVKRGGIDEVHDVAARGEPARMGARTSAHVHNDLRGRRQVAEQQFARAFGFERPMA